MIYETKHKPIEVRYNKSFDFVAHAQRGIEVLICTEGNWRVSCNFCTETLHAGEAMIAFPNDIHAYHKTCNGKGILIFVDPLVLQNAACLQARVEYANFMRKGNPRLISLAHALLEEYNGKKNVDVMIGYLFVIIGSIVQELSANSKARAIETETFSRVLQYLSKHYTSKLTLESLGKTFGVSPCHLSRTFSQKLSCPFVRYLHLLRVEHAKHLLRHSRMSILEIAYDSGFSDQRTFHRVFKEQEGITPKEYRNSLSSTF